MPLSFARVVLLAVAALFLLAACKDGKDGDDSAIIQVIAHEYSYAMPDSAEGGVVTFELENDGSTLHEFAFGRIDPGHTAEEVQALFESEGGEPPDWIHDLGGVPVLSPGKTATLTRELREPGTYVFLCAIPDAQGKPHISLGMIKLFELSGDSGASLPEADVVIEATDDAFVVPELQGGTQLIELRNSASEPREFQMLSLEQGKTFDDLEAWFEGGLQGPAPALFPGGMQTIDAGTSVFLEMDLEAGRTYLLTSETEDGGEISSEFTPE